VTKRSNHVMAKQARNPYDVIGVARGAPKDEVRRSFRKLTVLKHPDVNPNNPIAAMEFTELVSAYNVIMGDTMSKTQFEEELEQIRAEAQVQYEKNLRKTLNKEGGGIYLYRAFELGVGFFLLWTTTQSPDILDKLGILPSVCDANGKCYNVNVLPSAPRTVAGNPGQVQQLKAP